MTPGNNLGAEVDPFPLSLPCLHLLPSAPWLRFSPCFSSHAYKYEDPWLDSECFGSNSLPGDRFSAPFAFSKRQDPPQPPLSPEGSVFLLR